jgi:BlaI family penicillinase repressor
MRIVWDRGEVTVRDVYEELLHRRKIAYTSVMTTMKTLEEKGYLKASQRDRAYVYKPTRPKEQVVRKMVRDFIDRVFDGSAQPLVAHLLEERRLTESDLAEITRLITKDSRRAKGIEKKG